MISHEKNLLILNSLLALPPRDEKRETRILYSNRSDLKKTKCGQQQDVRWTNKMVKSRAFDVWEE